MPRKSERLISFGYYDDKEEPYISYKEYPYRVFQRRRSRRHSGASSISNMSSVSAGIAVDRPTSSWRLRNTYLFVIVLACFGACVYKMCTSSSDCFTQDSGRPEYMLTKLQEHVTRAGLIQMQLKELQEELLHLKTKLLPFADTMPNFALESQGATILHHLTSETYQILPPLVTFWGLPLWYPAATPRILIQGHSTPLTPGHCWAFVGRQGHVFISLSHPVIVTHVTLGHISGMQSPTGFPYSAPRTFSVYGLKKVDDEATSLGTFVYDANGESLQTFKSSVNNKSVLRFVKLQIESNWGHPEYTCLYNFRVHGNLPQVTENI